MLCYTIHIKYIEQKNIVIIIIIIKNKCHSNIIVDRLQGCENINVNKVT